MALPAWTCSLGRIAYEDAARLQRSLRAAREAGAIPDTTLILEHEPVITTGHRTELHEVAHALTSGIPVIPTERGGKATWHGPGQIVAYPILDLRGHGTDVRAYVCALENAVIETLADLEIAACRRAGEPGVWIAEDADAAACVDAIGAGIVEGAPRPPQKKIASIGVRVTRWVSFHGVALNVNCDMSGFAQFTPCGIADARMTSVALERGVDAPSFQRVQDRFASRLHAALNLTCTEVPLERLMSIAADYPVEEPSLESVALRDASPILVGAGI